MTEHILVAAAWPYANAEIHVGNLTGSYLPADIFARYQRMRGRKVMFVSGTDSHGTPLQCALTRSRAPLTRFTSVFTPVSSTSSRSLG